MIKREGKLNLSTSGGSDLNQELVENSDYTKSTSESGMMSNDGVKSSDMNNGENTDIANGSTGPNQGSMMGENDVEDYDKKDAKGGNSVSDHSNDDNYKVSDMNSRIGVEKENKPDGNSQPTQLKNGPTENDMPYDVPDDQTPRMSDMPKNIEKMTNKSAPDKSMDE